MPIKLRTRPISIPGERVIEAALNAFRIAIENFVRELNQCPVVSGSLIEDEYIETGSYHKIYHKLGRKPNGWLLIKTDGLSYYNCNEATDQYISVYFLGTTTASFWFF